MADKKISQLTELTQVNVDVDADYFAIVDSSATETKKILVDAAVLATLSQSSVPSINGTTIPTSKTLVVTTDIGTTVQAYDADTAKYDDTTANFTGTLQNSGSNVVVDSDIGSTVQAYDVNTAKYDDTTANFTGTLQNGGHTVLTDASDYLDSADIGVNVLAYDSNLQAFVTAVTLPETDGSADQVLATNGSGTVSWVDQSGGGGGITYTRQTTTYTAAAGEGIIADTSGGAWTLTLPATPTTGDVVVVSDGDDWTTNNLTVDRNGETIEGLSENLVFDIGGTEVQFIYDGTTWQVFTKTGFTNPVPFATTGKAIAMAIVFG